MKITFVLETFNQKNNYISLVLKKIISNLLKDRHEIRVLSSKKDYEQIDNVTSFLVDDTIFAKKFFTFSKYITLNTKIENLGFNVSYKIQKEVIKKAVLGSDIVIFLTPFKLSRKTKSVCDYYGVPSTYITSFLASNYSFVPFLSNITLSSYTNKFKKILSNDIIKSKIKKIKPVISSLDMYINDSYNISKETQKNVLLIANNKKSVKYVYNQLLNTNYKLNVITSKKEAYAKSFNKYIDMIKFYDYSELSDAILDSKILVILDKEVVFDVYFKLAIKNNLIPFITSESNYKDKYDDASLNIFNKKIKDDFKTKLLNLDNISLNKFEELNKTVDIDENILKIKEYILNAK